ncbi:GntR family transcriptional regulator [Mesobacterium pallidum]|uniref:GntR family transcriptional regulator n=1 Tax=Mesobacterium pallidum TaxID=2872037 RepID=UPI001EE3777B|nr:GntR family transcriptional regulator [Mesobacterium pallidum]
MVARKAADGAGLPAHEQVYRQLRDMILFGDLAPGQAVTIQGLVEATGAGMTPVREALRRLTAEGALDMAGNRRVSVPVLSAGNLDEMIHARSALDPELARRACLNATPGDIAVLAAEDARLDAAILRGDVSGYLRHNYLFHAELYDLARAPILRDLAMGLWLRFGPSLRVICGRMGTSSLPDQHAAALTALRNGDAEAAAAAIRADVVQGMEQVRAALPAEG